MTSTDSKLNISAKQGIQLACGGGGIRIKRGMDRFEIFSPTGVDIKAPNFAYKGPESVQIQMPNFDIKGRLNTVIGFMLPMIQNKF
ncbi:Rhs element Vgr protein [Klebsiella michiganensis]|nr:Rhs element Vgr protein [Klebsiella michiganensis]